jgi:hypothetical protein
MMQSKRFGPETQLVTRSMKRAAILGLLLSGAVGFLSVDEAYTLAHLSAWKQVQEAQPTPKALTLPSEAPTSTADAMREQVQLFRDVNAVVQAAQISALEPMSRHRSALLTALAFACALAFAASIRLLRPSGLSIEGMRRLLGMAALIAAVLRTIEGAQFTVIARRMGAALDSALANGSPDSELTGAMASLMTSASVGLTALIAGSFLVLSLYFRSEKVKLALAGDSSQ